MIAELVTHITCKLGRHTSPLGCASRKLHKPTQTDKQVLRDECIVTTGLPTGLLTTMLLGRVGVAMLMIEVTIVLPVVMIGCPLVHVKASIMQISVGCSVLICVAIHLLWQLLRSIHLLI
jgi:hypothetical protein